MSFLLATIGRSFLVRRLRGWGGRCDGGVVDVAWVAVAQVEVGWWGRRGTPAAAGRQLARHDRRQEMESGTELSSEELTARRYTISSHLHLLHPLLRLFGARNPRARPSRRNNGLAGLGRQLCAAPLV